MKLYLPSDIRSQPSWRAGVMLMWSERELTKLALLGDAVDIGDKEYRIPQHHALSVDDAMAIIGGYRRFAEDIGFSCVFRGQTRDYFGKSGQLLVLPAILRKISSYLKYTGNHREFRAVLSPWLEVMSEFGIDTGSGVKVDTTLRIANDRVLPGSSVVTHPLAVLRANPVVAGILQHYGFPTDHLDATTDPDVALWFALHRSITSRRRISFLPLPARAWVKRASARNPVDRADVPTLQIYVQPPYTLEERYSLVDLTGHDALTRVARRPTCQSALTLPFGGFTVGRPSLSMLPLVGIMSPMYRWPAAIVKLYFPFAAVGRQDLTADTLFPKDEPLYRRLLEIKAPHLAIYA